MKPIQLILIAVAVVAALGAGLLMMNVSRQPAAVIEAAAPTAPTVQVLVASEDIPMGNDLKAERLSWQEWPESGVRESFITQKAAPEAIKEYAPTIARNSFFAGEPIREEKIVRSDSGYLSAILPAGKRAVAIRVTADTSAGGFILPNDHVDVVMSYEKEDSPGSESENKWITETILENVRVLAIDQIIEDKEGEKSKVGDTATLELTPEQVEVLAVSNNIAKNRLMLALRSVEDSGGGESAGAVHLLSKTNRRRAGNIRLIRFGKTKEIRPKK